MQDTFWGLGPAAWVAIGALGTLVLALATAILVWVGVAQIKAAREEAKRNRTLTACDRYDTDPVLNASLQRLARARRASMDKFQGDGLTYRPDIATLLNYLDSLAVGIMQELYIEEIVRDHNGPIVRAHVEQYLTDGNPRIFGLNPDNYRPLRDLYEKWSRQQPYYRPARRRLSLFRRSGK
jgi:hypothetical protein